MGEFLQMAQIVILEVHFLVVHLDFLAMEIRKVSIKTADLQTKITETLVRNVEVEVKNPAEVQKIKVLSVMKSLVVDFL